MSPKVSLCREEIAMLRTPGKSQRESNGGKEREKGRDRNWGAWENRKKEGRRKRRRIRKSTSTRQIETNESRANGTARTRTKTVRIKNIAAIAAVAACSSQKSNLSFHQSRSCSARFALFFLLKEEVPTS